jgi:putative oxidoreductase
MRSGTPRDWHNGFVDGLSRLVPEDLLALAARIGIGATFWLSGRTKVEGLLAVRDGAIDLFREEYRLPLVDPSVAAHLAAYAEHLFPTLLFLGLFTRLSAGALFFMTLVIQVFVYPDAWPTHLGWAAIFLYLVRHGAGRVALDAAFGLR